MHRKLVLICLTLVLVQGIASATQYAYQINFSNKNGSPAFSDSLSFLSHRALSRRAAQGLTLDSSDLPVPHAYLDSVVRLTGGKIHEVSRWLNLCVVLISDSTRIHTLSGKSFIQSTRLVGYYAGTLHKGGIQSFEDQNQIASKTTGGATYYDQSWTQTLMVKGNYLHDLGFKAAGKLIAVIDAGFIYTDTHPGFDSLRTSGRIAETHNFTLDTSFVYGYDIHGTSVLSTMAGYVPDTYVGSAPLATYALYVTEDDNSEQPIELINMLCAAERADSLGADIISSSLGYNTFDDPADDLHFATDCDGKSTIAAKAANMATKKGILFVASAGNEGGNSWNMVLTPGDADSALTVGSVNTSAIAVGSSGYGPNAAGQIKPDVCGLGHYASVFSSTGYNSEDGTSLSTPQIAGWAACLLQAAPGSTPSQLRRAIVQCADHYSSPDNHIGYGIPDFSCAALALNVLDTPVPNPNSFSVVSPNPTGGTLFLTVTVATQQPVSFRLLDITGRTALTYSAQFNPGENLPVKLDISALPAGIYILKAVSKDSQKILKLVKE